MKKILTLSLLTIAFVSCEQKQEAKPEVAKVDYAVFGDSISFKVFNSIRVKLL